MVSAKGVAKGLLVLVLISGTVVLFQNCSGEEFDPNAYTDKSSKDPSDNDPEPEPIPPSPTNCTLPNGTAVAQGTVTNFFTAATASCGQVCSAPKALTCQNAQFRDEANAVVDVSALSTSCTKTLCDARTVTGFRVMDMVPGKPYLVSVYGVTANRGDGAVNLVPPQIQNCQGNTLSVWTNRTINWHDGQAPHSAAFAVNAPADGCIQGRVDAGNALSMTVVEQPKAGTMVTANNTSLLPNTNYLVAVQGVTQNRGNGTETLGGTTLTDIVGLSYSVGDIARAINWADGQVPVHAFISLTTPPVTPLAYGVVDSSITNTQGLVVFESSGGATTSGNTITNLTAGKKYFVHAYGITTNRGDGNATLNGVRIVNCANNAVLASTPATTINWHDGQAVQSAGLVVTAPAGGCIRGFNDGIVTMMTRADVL